MIGIVAALFCTLVVAGLCSYCFKMDHAWYNALSKPQFLLSGGWFSLFVGASYLSCILSVSRLVEYKHLFPSMLFFVLLGTGCVLFVWSFFTLKNLLAALIFMTLVLAMAYTLFLRFLTKEVRLALEFLPTLLFDIYAFIVVLCIVMAN